MLELRKVSKIYKGKKKHKAIDNISLMLSDSGFVFIVGKSGSGKSTLLNLIGWLDTITQGSIICDDIDVACLTANDRQKYLSSYIGFVF